MNIAQPTSAASSLPAGRRMLFCVGAQKAGTSWLFRFVDDHPECHFPVTKEVHYFDHVHGVAQMHFGARLKKVKMLAERLPLEQGARLDGLLDKLHTEVSLARLYKTGDGGRAAYIYELMRDAGPDKVLCDFTPSYAMLPPEGFADMAGMADDTRFIFIMRDPVERLWSQMRMKAKGAKAQRGEDAPSAEEILEQMLDKTDTGWAGRTDYRQTVEAMEATLPSDKRLFLFYETLFSQDVVDRVCDFAGIARMPAQLDAKVNAGQSSPMPEALRARCRAFLAPQYAFVEERFGAEMPAFWRDAA